MRPDSHDPESIHLPADGDGEGFLDLTGVEGDVDLQALADEVASVDGRADLESAIKAAEKQIQEVMKRESELMDQHRRLAADFNNFRNRATRDIALSVDQAERKIFQELLPVLDNFERSLEANYQDVDALRNGVELIRKQFLDTLRRLQVEPLPIEVGEPFDAQKAEALTTMTNPELPDGSVAAVYERGYNLRNLLLRPARVVVNRLPEGN